MPRTVITFGTFDVFHVGHLRVIERAAALGDRLVVGVSADALNISKKGREPVFSQAERIADLARTARRLGKQNAALRERVAHLKAQQAAPAGVRSLPRRVVRRLRGH